MKREKYTMHYVNDRGEILQESHMDGLTWKLRKLLDGREHAVDYPTDNLYKVQQEAMREWIMKLKW